MARKFKLNCLTVLTPNNRILRSEDQETYPESVFGEQADELLKAGKIVEVGKKKASKSEKTSDPNFNQSPGTENEQ